jgi:hypothetical protein
MDLKFESLNKLQISTFEKILKSWFELNFLWFRTSKPFESIRICTQNCKAYSNFDGNTNSISFKTIWKAALPQAQWPSRPCGPSQPTPLISLLSPMQHRCLPGHRAWLTAL